MIKRIFKIMFSEMSIIPWMMLVSLLPMIFVSLFSYNIAKQLFQENIEGTLMISLLKKIEIINNYVSERKLDLMQISGLPDLMMIINKFEKYGETTVIDRNSITKFNDYLLDFAKEVDIENIYLLSENGKIIYSLKDEGLLGKALIDLPSQRNELYKAYMGAKILRIPFLINYYDPNKTPKSGIYLANPVLDLGKTKAVLVMQLNADVIQGVVSSYLGYGNILEQTYLGIMLDNNPFIFMHSKGQKDTQVDNIDPQLLKLMDDAIKGNRGKPIIVKINNSKDIVVYDYVPQLNMGMLLEYNEQEIYRHLRWLKFQMVITIATSLILVFITVFLIARKLMQANIKSERLLENILPRFVIEELKEKKQFLPRKVMATSVLFCDIVNFTLYAAKTSPENVVKLLDDFFSMFDQLIGEFGMEKIKTIGDAYMAVSGLISPESDHANRAVNLGLAMIKAIKHYNLDHHTNFSVRVGIDSGEVTTGIIGQQKFSYDLWGNAVNRASRMESTGIADKVQISSATYEALQNKNQYSINLRSEVVVKGLGVMDTYIID